MMKNGRHSLLLKIGALLAVAWGASLGVSYGEDMSKEQNPHSTMLGVFNPQSPEEAKTLGAKAVRLFVTPLMLKQGHPAQFVEKFAAYKRAGFTVIVTFSSSNEDRKTPLPEMNSAAWNEMGDQFEAWLKTIAPSTDYIAVGNEPLVDNVSADLKPRANGQIPIIEFYKERARRAHRVINGNPGYAHIKVSSPALFNLQMIGVKGFGDGHLALPIFNWEINDPNIEVIDLHTHVAAPSEIDNALNFVQQKTGKPLIITEWSQARAARDWLEAPMDSAFIQKWGVTPRQTNSDFIHACYERPVQKTEWDEFVAKAPYDPSFMKEAFAVIKNHGVLVATYGAGKQYGSIKFDGKQLLANLTVVPGPNDQPQENYLFATWYRELATSIAKN